MEQRSLKVLDANKTFFSQITTTLTKLLIPTKLGINNVLISIKRNNMIKAYNNYIQVNEREETDKKEILQKKYEEYYAIYLEAIDKYIIDSVYKKVKNNTATNFEKDALAKYYMVVSLKENQYVEYKYRKQEYLIRVDYENIVNSKKENLISKYNEFYVNKMESLYKGILKNYSIQITDNISSKFEENEKTYDKIFRTLETYILEVLPIKMKINQNGDYEKIVAEYERYEQANIGKLDIRDSIKKRMILLGISRYLFTHSLPLVATEQCYLELIDEVQNLILQEKNKAKQNNLFDLLIELEEEFSNKLLSTKIYWDKPEEREEYKKFWDSYKKIINEEMNDKDLKNKKQILFLKYDLKKLCVNSRKHNKIIKIYKSKLVELGVMKRISKIRNIKIKATKQKVSK